MAHTIALPSPEELRILMSLPLAELAKSDIAGDFAKWVILNTLARDFIASIEKNNTNLIEHFRHYFNPKQEWGLIYLDLKNRGAFEIEDEQEVDATIEATTQQTSVTPQSAEAILKQSQQLIDLAAEFLRVAQEEVNGVGFSFIRNILERKTHQNAPPQTFLGAYTRKMHIRLQLWAHRNGIHYDMNLFVPQKALDQSLRHVFLHFVDMGQSQSELSAQEKSAVAFASFLAKASEDHPLARSDLTMR